MLWQTATVEDVNIYGLMKRNIVFAYHIFTSKKSPECNEGQIVSVT